jgi:hypothetical protein
MKDVLDISTVQEVLLMVAVLVVWVVMTSMVVVVTVIIGVEGVVGVEKEQGKVPARTERIGDMKGTEIQSQGLDLGLVLVPFCQSRVGVILLLLKGL